MPDEKKEYPNRPTVEECKSFQDLIVKGMLAECVEKRLSHKEAMDVIGVTLRDPSLWVRLLRKTVEHAMVEAENIIKLRDSKRDQLMKKNKHFNN